MQLSSPFPPPFRVPLFHANKKQPATTKKKARENNRSKNSMYMRKTGAALLVYGKYVDTYHSFGRCSVAWRGAWN